MEYGNQDLHLLKVNDIIDETITTQKLVKENYISDFVSLKSLNQDSYFTTRSQNTPKTVQQK